MKIFKISFLVCFFAFNLSAADKASDDTYVFEAKGEFAKELKSLIEKHSKDENVTVNIYKNTPNAKGNIVGGGTKINRNINYIKEKGKVIYDANCASCHGSEGQKRAYGSSRKLKDLSAKEIAIAISSYTSDGQYGKKMKYIMQPIAAKTTAEEVGYIIGYLKGDDEFLYDSPSRASGNTEISTAPSEQGSYLK
nr:cytochrome c [uncultured Campylobacter sp.]